MDTRFCLHPVIIDEDTVFPCGKCPVCRMKYRKQMALRIYMEQCIEKPFGAYFITLTYNDENIPITNGRQCFDKIGTQRFLDSLRKKLYRKGVVCRHFLTCEYGESGYRPHMHALFFLYSSINAGRSLVDFKKRCKAQRHYFSDEIVSPLWNSGFVYNGSVTPRSVMYCTAYALKDDESLERDWTGFEEGRPFRLFSNRPGLGCTAKCVQWWKDYVYNDGDPRTAISVKGVSKLSSGVPVGIKRKLKDYFPDEYEALKEANMSYFEESVPQLFENAAKFGSARNYQNKSGVDPVDRSPDIRIKAFLKASRAISKKNRKPLK